MYGDIKDVKKSGMIFNFIKAIAIRYSGQEHTLILIPKKQQSLRDEQSETWQSFKLSAFLDRLLHRYAYAMTNKLSMLLS